MAVKSVARSKLSAKLLENLEGEISILTSMRHTNIVDLRECLYTEEHIHMIMEYCPGGDLSQYIRKRGDIPPWNGDELSNPLAAAQRRLFPHPEDGGLNDAMVRSLLTQLASALRFLRSRDIVHRDIKPQNLLLRIPDEECLASGHPREMPQIKVADFGFARSLPAASLAKTLCGSPLYMAPEILRYEKYDAKADLWSVGAVLYEMSVGKPPFRATNHVELLRRIEQSNDRIKFPDERSQQSLARDATRRRLNGEAPRLPPHPVAPDIKALVRKLLKRHPVERISFDEFFHDNIIMSVPYVGRAISKDDLTASMLSDHAQTASPLASRMSDHTPAPGPKDSPRTPNLNTDDTADERGMSCSPPSSPTDQGREASPPRDKTTSPSRSATNVPDHEADGLLANRLMGMPLQDKARTTNTAFGFQPDAEPESAPASVAMSKRMETERPFPPSALSRAINRVHPSNPSRVESGEADTRSSAEKSSTTAPLTQPITASSRQEPENDLSSTLRSLAQKSYVLSEFADAKLAEYQAAVRAPAASVGGISPAGSSPNSAALHIQENTVADGLALYVRALSFLQRGLAAINGYAASLRNTEPTEEMREFAHWYRVRFDECYERSMYARNCCTSATLPDSMHYIDRQIFDKALELARAAALEELEGNRDGLQWDPTNCVLAYETASSLLSGLLDPSEDRMALSTNSVSTVEKFLKSINKRLDALHVAPTAAAA